MRKDITTLIQRTIMDMDDAGAGGAADAPEGEEKEVDPDVLEDTFDDVDNL
ncbi:MAG: hypothetical protein Q7R88_01170 [bacterium]|nr:hypothetical protein [bacterium]